MGLKLPEWTKDFYPDKLIEFSKLSLEMNVYNETMRKMKAGPMITKIANAMKDKSEGKLKPAERKMLMYVGHDSTIATLLAGLNVWENREIPGYNNMVMIELHEDKSGWNVQVSFLFKLLSSFTRQILNFNYFLNSKVLKILVLRAGL